ncbi:uncharacterized protein LOC131247418 [Magnolia sinica]|uniref:uncharacterized protein LOC131247418 n=1 Tax=Magnolia sinica TaxID=86752 RepID=UPI00265A454D|nr:uncharacterized protein LOC131247418 [Magnolia sinica]
MSFISFVGLFQNKLQELQSQRKMKNKASILLKPIVSLLGSLSKAKELAVKGKSNAMKARLIIVGLLRNKKVLLPAISHKIHALLGHDKGGHHDNGCDDHNREKAIIVYNALANEASPDPCLTLQTVDHGGHDDDDDRYPDLTHSLFDELDFDNGTDSVIDLVRNCREDGSDFSLEDEIDHVADLFIRRFHRQMKMQKQESFKRYQEMLDRSV